MSRLEVLEGPTGRRLWPDEVKARIVAESLVPGARVCEVAERHRIAPQSLTTWRRLAREGRFGPSAERTTGFASLVVEGDPPAERGRSGEGLVEIEARGVTVRLPMDVSSVRIGDIAAALRQA
jgi:transposase